MITTEHQLGSSFVFVALEMDVLKIDERLDGSPGDSTEPDEGQLEDAAKSEREYVRQRLRDELKREPSEIELDEWLRQHTEGY